MRSSDGAFWLGGDEPQGAHERQRGSLTPMGQARWAREAWVLDAGCEQDARLSRLLKSTKNYIIETIRFVRRGSNLLKPGQILSPISIEAADQHGTALAVEPGLNAVPHMGRSVDLGIFIMRNTDVLPLGVPN